MCLGQIGVRVVNKANQWKWSICNGIKDRIPASKQTGMVYEMSCLDCPGKYVGETLRSLETRVKEHMRHAKPGGRFDQSAIAEHVHKDGHKIDRGNVKILSREDKWWDRKVKESLFIKILEPSLNQDSGLQISLLWKNALSI